MPKQENKKNISQLLKKRLADIEKIEEKLSELYSDIEDIVYFLEEEKQNG